MTSRSVNTILCIDDDVQTLRFRKMLLELHGYNVITVPSGSEGLEILSQGHPIDVVLLDYVMPDLSGEMVAQEVKRISPRLPIVVVSGFPDVPKTLLNMASGYVRKGQPPELVVEAVSRALNEK